MRASSSAIHRLRLRLSKVRERSAINDVAIVVVVAGVVVVIVVARPVVGLIVAVIVSESTLRVVVAVDESLEDPKGTSS